MHPIVYKIITSIHYPLIYRYTKSFFCLVFNSIKAEIFILYLGKNKVSTMAYTKQTWKISQTKPFLTFNSACALNI